MDSTTLLSRGAFNQRETAPILPDNSVNNANLKIMRNVKEIEPGGVNEEKVFDNEVQPKTQTATIKINSNESKTAVDNRFIDSSAPQLQSLIPIKMLPFNQFSSLTVTPPFVLKLCSMLSTKEFEYLIAWGRNEDTVLVKDLVNFSAIVLPKYFKHSKFTSFLRQLNMYGFHTLRQGENWREFKNDLFRKNASHEYDKIKRKTPHSTNNTRNGLDSRSNTLKSKQTTLKDSRKRKKDVFKRKSEKELKDIMKKQSERIEQLLTRCEANEEKIEALQLELLSVKREVSQIKKDGKKKSVPVAKKGVAETTEDANMLDADVVAAGGHEYCQSFAFAQIEGRQRTLSDTCLSNFTLSNFPLQQPTTQLSSSFQPNTFDQQQQHQPIRTPSGGPPWYWRKNSFDEMSLSFGGFNLGTKEKPSKNNSKKGKKNSKKKPSQQAKNSRIYVKDDKIKRKKKAMKTSNS